MGRGERMYLIVRGGGSRGARNLETSLTFFRSAFPIHRPAESNVAFVLGGYTVLCVTLRCGESWQRQQRGIAIHPYVSATPTPQAVPPSHQTQLLPAIIGFDAMGVDSYWLVIRTLENSTSVRFAEGPRRACRVIVKWS